MASRRPAKPKPAARSGGIPAPTPGEAAAPRTGGIPAPASSEAVKEVHIAQPTAPMFKGRAKSKPTHPTGLLAGQLRYLNDKSRNRLLEKGRQTGGDFINGLDAVRKLSPAAATLDMFVSSRDLSLAKQFLQRDCTFWGERLNGAASPMGEEVIDAEKGINAQVMYFASGRKIFSLSSNPDAHAGRSGHRKLNEFALLADNRRQYAVAKDGTRWGGNIDIWSTHRGTNNYFNELIQEIHHKGNPKKFSLHRYRFSDALADGLLFAIQSRLEEGDPVLDMDETDFFNYEKARAESAESFMEENECVPQDDAACFLDYDLITKNEYGIGAPWELPLDECQGQLFLGFDVARKKDLSAIVILEALYGLLFTRRLLVMERKTFAYQREQLYKFLDHPRLMRACIDNTGVGMQIAEEAQTKYGWKVEPVTFTPAAKESMAYPLRSAFEDGTIRIPHDRALQNDLRAIKKIALPGGGVRFAADHGANGHADRFWAYALAKRASLSPSEIMPFTALNRGISGPFAAAVASRGSRALVG